jgi:hypothetical protein
MPNIAKLPTSIVFVDEANRKRNNRVPMKLNLARIILIRSCKVGIIDRDGTWPPRLVLHRDY